MKRPNLVVGAGMLVAAQLALSGCAAGNTGAKLSISHIALPSIGSAPAAQVNLPPPCPGALMAALPPEPVDPPPGAGFPRPETASAGAAVQAYFTWLHGYGAWARAGWARAAVAQSYCGGR